MDHHSCKPYLRQWWRAALDQPILEEATFEWEEGRSVLSVPACFGSASLPAARAQCLLPSSPDHPRNRIGRLWWHIYHHVQGRSHGMLAWCTGTRVILTFTTKFTNIYRISQEKICLLPNGCTTLIFMLASPLTMCRTNFFRIRPPPATRARTAEAYWQRCGHGFFVHTAHTR